MWTQCDDAACEHRLLWIVVWRRGVVHWSRALVGSCDTVIAVSCLAALRIQALWHSFQEGELILVESARATFSWLGKRLFGHRTSLRPKMWLKFIINNVTACHQREGKKIFIKFRLLVFRVFFLLSYDVFKTHSMPKRCKRYLARHQTL